MSGESSIPSVALALFLFQFVVYSALLLSLMMTIVAQMKAPLRRRHVSLLTDLHAWLQLHQVECSVMSRNFAREQINAPELIIFATVVSECACLCVLVPPSWPASTFGCTSPPQRISGSGRSRV